MKKSSQYNSRVKIEKRGQVQVGGWNDCGGQKFGRFEDFPNCIVAIHWFGEDVDATGDRVHEPVFDDAGFRVQFSFEAKGSGLFDRLFSCLHAQACRRCGSVWPLGLGPTTHVRFDVRSELLGGKSQTVLMQALRRKGTTVGVKEIVNNGDSQMTELA